MNGLHTFFRNTRFARGLDLVLAGSFVFLLVLSAFCPLPNVAIGQDLSWGDRGVPMVECPFHPGQRATFSTALQFSLEHLNSLPAAGDPLTSPLVSLGADADGPPQSDRPPWRAIDLRKSRPHPVPLYLLHASLIR